MRLVLHDDRSAPTWYSCITAKARLAAGIDSAEGGLVSLREEVARLNRQLGIMDRKRSVESSIQEMARLNRQLRILGRKRSIEWALKELRLPGTCGRIKLSGLGAKRQIDFT
jgi:hypothetical protein